VNELTGAPSIALDGWTLHLQRGLPALFNLYRGHAELVDEFDLRSCDGDVCYASAGPVGVDWPSLVVVQRFSPSVAGFDPGIAFLPESRLLLLGAGTRILAYDLTRPARLWEDTADIGFWSWHVYPTAVLMSAELELAAWDRQGTKLWTRFVEPPWSFQVERDTVHLDVMGEHTQFPLHD